MAADISVGKFAEKVYVIIPEHTCWGNVDPANDQVRVIELIKLGEDDDDDDD